MAISKSSVIKIGGGYRLPAVKVGGGYRLPTTSVGDACHIEL